MHTLRLAATLVLAAWAAAAAVAAPGQAVEDGGFEAYGPVASWRSLPAGSNAVPGWHVASGNVALVGRYFRSYEGTNSMEVGSPGPGAIEQTLQTIRGRRYRLTFALSGNPEGPPRVKRLFVSAGSTTRPFDFDVRGRSREAMGWERESLEFTAVGTVTILRFARRDGGTTAWWGPVIDDVAVAFADTPPGTVQTPSSGPVSAPPPSSPPFEPSRPDPFSGLWMAGYPGHPLRVFLERHGDEVVAHAIDGHTAIPAGHLAWEGRVDRAPIVVLSACVDPDAKGWHGAVIEWAGADAFHLRVANCHAGDVLYTRIR